MIIPRSEWRSHLRIRVVDAPDVQAEELVRILGPIQSQYSLPATATDFRPVVRSDQRVVSDPGLVLKHVVPAPAPRVLPHLVWLGRGRRPRQQLVPSSVL